jgi:hypothetical protein
MSGELVPDYEVVSHRLPFVARPVDVNAIPER